MSGSLANTVYERLREAIGNLELPPGTHLQESELAAEFGVSRTPIREALRRLSSEGFVDLAHGRGATVAQGNLRDVLDAYEIRRLLEPYAAAQAAIRGRTNPQLAEIEGVLAGLSSAPESDEDIRERERLDRELHSLIANLTGNQLLTRVISDLHARVQRVYLQLGSGGRFESIRSEHLRILAAIRSGDAELAAKAMRDHLDGNTLNASGGMGT